MKGREGKEEEEEEEGEEEEGEVWFEIVQLKWNVI